MKYQQTTTLSPLLLFLLFVLCSCSSHSPTNFVNTARTELAYQYQTTENKSFQAPVFLIKDPEFPYNRIGLPSARESAEQDVEIFVDPDKPALFYEKQLFSTKQGTYQNLVYRIHFEKVPFALNKLNLTAGKNGGLLVIYTLNEDNQLLLITTVHTCGCYLTFFPTSALSPDRYPANWPKEKQKSFGYILPSQLSPPSQNKESNPERVVFTIESETHRISDVAILKEDKLHHTYETQIMVFLPMDELYQLPYKEGTESFFETVGPRSGYVRNNTKFLERLLISWWAFDLQVGEDKAYGTADTSDTIFYTSLKFWDRKASDLKNFPEFLAYWGWEF